MLLICVTPAVFGIPALLCARLTRHILLQSSLSTSDLPSLSCLHCCFVLCAATLVDTVGSAALVTMSLRSGVSLSISVNYISAMPGGEDAEIDARVVKVKHHVLHTRNFLDLQTDDVSFAAAGMTEGLNLLEHR